MRNGILVGAAVLAMGVAPAFAEGPQSGAKPAQKQNPARSAEKRGVTKPASDEHFAAEAAHAGIAEVEIGKLAAEKATSPAVKSFAQRMVDDHGRANEELKTLAQNKNLALPTMMDAAHKAALDRLSKLSGEAFDRAYAREMLNGHRKVVAMFSREARAGNDPDVKAWAAKTLPTLEDHLKRAEDLNGKPATTTAKAGKKRR